MRRRRRLQRDSSGRIGHAHFDAIGLVGDINLSTLNLSVNGLGRIQKGLLDVEGRLGGGLQKEEAIGVRKGLSLGGGDRPTVLEIRLVANEENDHVRLRMLLGFFEPAGEVLKGITAGNVVDEEGSGSAAVVGAGDGAKGLLSGRVPDLQLDGLFFDREESGSEFYANGEVMDGLEAFVGELEEEAGLADACGSV